MRIKTLIIALVAPLVLVGANSFAALQGEFVVMRGTGPEGVTLAGTYLRMDDGSLVEVTLPEETLAAAGGLWALNGHPVQVTASTQRDGTLTATAVDVLGPRINRATGTQPWASILCEFPGDASGVSQQQSLSYYEDMYRNSYPGLRDFWGELSYGALSVAGSDAFGWYELPNPQDEYVFGDLPDFTTLSDDCLSLAQNAGVDLAAYNGIHLMFDESLGQSDAYGGGSVTFIGPSGWSNITSVAQAMGFGFDLPSSSNYDGQDDFDNPYDVMSAATYAPSATGDYWHNTYGLIGQHTTAYAKNDAGWIPANKVFQVPEYGDTYLINVDHLDDLTSGYAMANIGGPGGVFYTVEARSQEGYDIKLPQAGVFVYEVDPARVQPAWLVGCTTDDDADCGGGQLWVGDTYDNDGDDVTVRVVGQTANGFVVKVSNEGFIRNVGNGGMEANSDGNSLPDGWSLAGPEGFQLCSDIYSFNGDCLYVFQGDGGVNALIQPLYRSGSQGDTFTLQARFGGINIPQSTAAIGVRVIFDAENGANQVQDCLTDQRGTFLDYVTVQCQLTANQDYENITLLVGWIGGAGLLGVDDVSLSQN